MGDQGKVIDLKARKGHLQRQPFVPLTGNPENGNYSDWVEHLKVNSEVISFTDEKSGPP